MKNTRIDIFEGYPSHLKEFIDQRYKTYMLARSFIANSDSLEDVTTLLIYEQEVLQEALLFVISGASCKLLNSLTHIPQPMLNSFCSYIFTNYKAVKKISIVWQNEMPKLDYSVKCKGQVDVYIELPYNIDQYNSMLGKKTRTQMGNYYRRIQKDYSEIVFHFDIPCSNLSMENWKRVIALKENRQKSKRIHNSFNEDKVSRERAIYDEIGYLSMVTHNDNIIGALLSYKIQDIVYARMVAFDIYYYKYSVARVLLYQSIVKSIENRDSEYHLLWRNADYMDHYGGKDLQLHSISVFRSYGIGFMCELCRAKVVFLYGNFKSSKAGKLAKRLIKRVKS